MALSIISTTTSQMNLSEQALSSIGRLLVYIQKKLLPTTPFPLSFSRKSKYEEKYIRMFANQLQITNDTDIQNFGFHAISILINKDLSPHCDSMNPSAPEDDYTLSLSVQVPTSDLPEDIQERAISKYGLSVPLCIVVYKRKCLHDYCKRMKKLEEFKDNNPKKKEGRKRLIKILSSTYTDADYVGNFFDPQRWLDMKQSFKLHYKVDNRQLHFDAPMLVTNEAVDKMSYWSSLLHMYYLHVLKNGVANIEYSFSFVIFFAHQCNGTITIVKAMIQLLEEDNNSDKSTTFYKKLCNTCCKINDIRTELRTEKFQRDVGHSAYNRHQPSANSIYKEDEIRCYIDNLQLIFGLHHNEMNRQSNNAETKYRLFHQLTKEICTLMKGIGPVRCMHLIHLSSLIGLLPLEYYIYTPMHLSGGPGNYLRNYMNYNEDCNIKLKGKTTNEQLIEWTVTEMKELQDHFTLEYTATMNENLSCIIGRTKKKYDVFFHLPWYNPEEEAVTKYDVQIMFRVNGYRKNNWTLEAYDGMNKVIQLHSKHVDKSRDVVFYSRNNGKLMDSGHVVNVKLLSNIRKEFTSTTFKCEH